jgi:hypothetical protein
MEEKNPSELRNSARHYRAMSDAANDPTLSGALLELAEEFEQEAAKMDGMTQTPPHGPKPR